ncbi:MAG: TlpA disulfide reductase family protein, partial [Gemmatimonadota bacterium]
FALSIGGKPGALTGKICNGSNCQSLSAIRMVGDSVRLEMSDYAAAIVAVWSGDSLKGEYRNVGNRGPRVIPFHASRGRWPVTPAPESLLGRWDATYSTDFETSPRVFEFRNGAAGMEGTIISNTGDYGLFWGRVSADSFAMAHFDGSFVYLLTGTLSGDTLRGIFHAGQRSETPWIAVRSSGASHLKSPTEITQADTSAPFQFSFPDLQGHMVRNTDARFRNKVLLVDIFGSWCPTCHDAAPDMVSLYRKYHARGLEIVGLAYEVSGDSAVDGRQVRRYRDKFGVPFPLLLAGINDTDAAAKTLPQLHGFTSFPTTVFLGRDGRVKLVHAGFLGPATGAQHEKQLKAFETEIERLLRKQN